MKQLVYNYLFAILLLTSIQQGHTQSLGCNDQINVSVNSSCAIDLSVDAFLEGSDSDLLNGMYTYVIFANGTVIVRGGNNGPTFGGDDMSPYIGSLLTFEVHYQGNGNYCWGYILVEDKIPPSIVCDCPVGGNGIGGYDPECTIACYEIPIIEEDYYGPLVNEIILTDSEDIFAQGVTDNCNNTNIDLYYYDQITDLGNCEGSILKRTFTINSGNSPRTACTKEYFIEPLDINGGMQAPFNNTSFGPVPIPIERQLLMPKALVEIPSCGLGNDPASIAQFFDNPETIDQDTDDDGRRPSDNDIDLVVENNEGIWYAYPHYYIKGRNPEGPHAQAINNEVCTLLSGYSDLKVEICAQGCIGNSKTIRSWVILDWCTGEYYNYDQIIKIVDGVGPTVTVNDIAVSVDPWECTADVHFPAPEHLFDACDNIVNYWIIGNSSSTSAITGNTTNGYKAFGVPVGIHTFRYVAEDCCNNTTTAEVKVIVQDNTPPVSVTKEQIVTSLTNIGNPNDPDNGISKIFAINVDNGSYDGCTDVTLEIRRVGNFCNPQDTVWGEFVKFCCDDLIGRDFVEIDVQFRVLDLFGNSNFAWTTVRLEDKSAPAIFCPQPMILNCDVDINDLSITGIPEGAAACGAYEYVLDPVILRENTQPREKRANVLPLYDVDGDMVPDVIPPYKPGCGFGAIRRQFKDNGLTICEQWFVIEEEVPFDASSIVFPRDISVDCDDYETGEPTFENRSCNLIGVSVESDTFMNETGACRQIINTWSVIDWCKYDPEFPFNGGRYNDIQIISIVDREDPVVSAIDSLIIPVGPDCTAKGILLSATATDNGECSSEWISWEVTVDLYSNWTPDYVYGSNLPQIIDGEPNPFYIPKSTNGEEISIIIPDDIQGSKTYHRIVWEANDGCNNRHALTRYFQVTDVKAPTPYCINLSTAFMENGQVELWAIDFNVGSFDNCTDSSQLLFTFTDVAPPPLCNAEYDSNSDLQWYDGTFWFYDSEVIEDNPSDNNCNVVGVGEYMDLDDYGDEVHKWEPALRSSGRIFTEADIEADGFVRVPVYVWDGCSNIDFCIVNLRILDNDGGGMVAGRIVNADEEPIEGIRARIEAALPAYPLEQVTDYNGEYAFGNTPFLLDYMVTITSDNDDYLNGVSTLDILHIQRHILGQRKFDNPYDMISADVNNDRNITALDLIELRKLILGIYDVLPNSDSWRYVTDYDNIPTTNPWQYSTQNTIQTMSADMMDQNFMALKVGDVNGTASFSVGDNLIERRSSGAVEFDLRDQKIVIGQLVELSMTTVDSGVNGFQFAIAYNNMNLVDIRSDYLSEANYSNQENVITFSYSGNEALSEGEIMTLTFESNTSGLLSDLIHINNQRISSEAYVGDNLELNDLKVRFGNSNVTTQLLQNQPNPFSENTIIGFVLSEAGAADITLYDTHGRMLRRISGDYASGYNEIEINKSDLNTTGLIYYQLISGDFSTTKHMVIVE